MGLFKGTQEQYYGFNSFKVAGSTTNSFTLDYPTLPANSGAFNVYLTGTVNGVTNTSRTLITAYSVAITSYTASTGVLVLNKQITICPIVYVILKKPEFWKFKYIKK